MADKLKGVVETRAGSKMARPEDLVRLYDIILQNYADMRDITSLDKDGEVYRMVDVNTLFYRTMRWAVVLLSSGVLTHPGVSSRHSGLLQSA